MTKLDKLVEAYLVEGMDYYKTSTGKTISMKKHNPGVEAAKMGTGLGVMGGVLGHGISGGNKKVAAISAAATGAAGALAAGLRARKIRREAKPFEDEILKRTKAQKISKDEYKQLRIKQMGSRMEKWNENGK